MPEFDDRSERNLATLRPKAQPWFRALLRALKDHAEANGLDVRIISANRTWAEQDALFAQGRTKPGNKVTNAPGGLSNHNYGVAVDIGLFRGGSYLQESPHYRKMGPLGEALGLEWGGRWTGFPDTPHYQIRTGMRIAALKNLVKTRGWPALDALIPTFQEAQPERLPTPKPPDATANPEPVRILESISDVEIDRDIDAWFVESRVWVSIREWAEVFGGAVVQRSTGWVLLLNDERSAIKTAMIAGRACAKFADLNAVLGWDFTFDGASRPRTLTIKADPLD